MFLFLTNDYMRTDCKGCHGTVIEVMWLAQVFALGLLTPMGESYYSVLL